MIKEQCAVMDKCPESPLLLDLKISYMMCNGSVHVIVEGPCLDDGGENASEFAIMAPNVGLKYCESCQSS